MLNSPRNSTSRYFSNSFKNLGHWICCAWLQLILLSPFRSSIKWLSHIILVSDSGGNEAVIWLPRARFVSFAHLRAFGDFCMRNGFWNINREGKSWILSQRLKIIISKSDQLYRKISSSILFNFYFNYMNLNH